MGKGVHEECKDSVWVKFFLLVIAGTARTAAPNAVIKTMNVVKFNLPSSGFLPLCISPLTTRKQHRDVERWESMIFFLIIQIEFDKRAIKLHKKYAGTTEIYSRIVVTYKYVLLFFAETLHPIVAVILHPIHLCLFLSLLLCLFYLRLWLWLCSLHQLLRLVGLEIEWDFSLE